MASRSQTPTTDIWSDLDGSAALDRYRELASLIGAGFYQLDSSSEFVAVSDALFEMTGYAREEVLGEPLSFLFEGENVAEIERDVHKPQGTENETITTTVSARRRDSRMVPCELRISRRRTDETSQVTIGIARQLSEPDGLSDQDVISTDDLSTVLTEVEGGLFILDSDFEVVWASETMGRYFGVDPETLVGRDKRGLVRDVIKHRSKPIESGLHAGGRIESYTEVTDQKEAAETLQETEQRFASLVDAVREYAIFRVDLNGNIDSWNEGAKNIKGYEAAEIRADVRRSEGQRTSAVDATDQWMLSIRDEGIGIGPADQERVFQVFQRLDRLGNHGSGIGLALCKRIVERHGGTIWVDSTPGEGTTVSFTLPAAGDADE